MANQEQKIIPFLWFDYEAEEAAYFYTAVFPQSKVRGTTQYQEAGKEFHGKEPGSVMTVDFELEGYRFVAINGGPQFKFTPSISFMVSCSSVEEVNSLWEKLYEGGTALMPLDTYPFSARYGWLQDKYGVSWQLIVRDQKSGFRPRFVPSLLFVGESAGSAESALQHYVEVFHNAKMGDIEHYGKNHPPNKEDMVMYADFMLEGQWFSAMDSSLEHDFTFSEALSFQVMCKDQAEIDYYWDKLTANGGEESMCGWLKDRYGISWQIVPVELHHLLNSADADKAKKVANNMFKMRKLDLNILKQAAGSSD